MGGNRRRVWRKRNQEGKNDVLYGKGACNMRNENLKLLIDTFDTIGYEIGELDDFCNGETENPYWEGTVKILICPVLEPEDPLSKEILVKLVEAMSSIGYGIAEYKILCKRVFGDISLVLCEYLYLSETRNESCL